MWRKNNNKWTTRFIFRVILRLTQQINSAAIELQYFTTISSNCLSNLVREVCLVTSLISLIWALKIVFNWNEEKGLVIDREAINISKLKHSFLMKSLTNYFNYFDSNFAYNFITSLAQQYSKVNLLRRNERVIFNG